MKQILDIFSKNIQNEEIASKLNKINNLIENNQFDNALYNLEEVLKKNYNYPKVYLLNMLAKFHFSSFSKMLDPDYLDDNHHDIRQINFSLDKDIQNAYFYSNKEEQDAIKSILKQKEKFDVFYDKVVAKIQEVKKLIDNHEFDNALNSLDFNIDGKNIKLTAFLPLIAKEIQVFLDNTIKVKDNKKRITNLKKVADIKTSVTVYNGNDISNFKIITDHIKNAKNLINKYSESIYKKAVSCTNYYHAYLDLTFIGNYKDSKNLADDLTIKMENLYLEAKNNAAKKLYRNASLALINIKGYKDSADLYKQYILKEKQRKNKITAISILIFLIIIAIGIFTILYFSK